VNQEEQLEKEKTLQSIINNHMISDESKICCVDYNGSNEESKESLEKLLPGAWLFDEIITAYFALLNLCDINKYQIWKKGHNINSYIGTVSKMLLPINGESYSS